jgi:hypothetical protein
VGVGDDQEFENDVIDVRDSGGVFDFAEGLFVCRDLQRDSEGGGVEGWLREVEGRERGGMASM